jgi:hypothetical protein
LLSRVDIPSTWTKSGKESKKPIVGNLGEARRMGDGNRFEAHMISFQLDRFHPWLIRHGESLSLLAVEA